MNVWSLFALVTVTWLLLAVGPIQDHCRAKRAGRKPIEAALSITPIIPLFPLLFIAIAMLMDSLLPPWGTRIVGGLHALLAIAFLVAIIWQAISPIRREPLA